MFNNSIEVWKSVDNVVNISIIGEIFATKRVLNDMTSKMSYAKERIYRKEEGTIGDIKKDMFRYIELFCIRKRLHSVLNEIR